MALHGHDLAAAEISRHVGDRLGIDQGAAVDLPEALRVELIDQLLDRLPDQGLDAGGLDPGVISSLMKNSTSSTAII